MRRVQPFPTQQDTDLAGGPGRVGLAQDPQFVPDRELPPTRTLQPLRHLGVRPTRAVRHNRQILPIDGAVLRHHGPSSFSTLVTNSSFAGVSPTIGREGVSFVRIWTSRPRSISPACPLRSSDSDRRRVVVTNLWL